jgi:large subunit ribosomal protein L21
MYAVIKTGGKQYRVAEGDVVEIEHLSVKGPKTSFTPVLVVTDDGKTVYGAKDLRSYSVSAKIVGDSKGDKVTVLKYRSKSGYSSKTGHRQLHSVIEITGISLKDSAPKKTEDAEKPETKPEPETQAEPEAKSEA